MATLDRLHERSSGRPRSSVPAVAPDARLEGDGFSRRFIDAAAGAEAPALQTINPADHARAALELGGALVEHSNGAVIVVDREYRADMLHGRTPIGDIVSTISGGDDALQCDGEGVALCQAVS